MTVNVDVEIRQYVATALWSSLDDDGGQLDATYDADDLAPESLESMADDVRAFIEANAQSCAVWQEAHGDGQIGHDLWLTRNGHGAGFWDRHYGGSEREAMLADVGDVLTAMAKPMGESDLYVGDDGKVYVS